MSGGTAAVIDLFAWAPPVRQSEQPPVAQPPEPASGNLSIAGLIAAYKSDSDSSYRRLRYRTRQNYNSVLGRLDRDHGMVDVRDVKARTLLRWHEDWKAGTKIAMAHALIGMLRTVSTFGATLLESDDCRNLKVLLHDMKFKMPKPRSERLTAEQVAAVITKAHELGWPSVALAQAIQFECTLRQKDVIGEWVPVAEPGESDVIDTEAGLKWHRGIRWEEIDAELVLHHVTSKRQKLIEPSLLFAPMVMDEWARLYPGLIVTNPDATTTINRHLLPASGAVIIDDKTGGPFQSHTFRRTWRVIADAAGIPKHIKNMDSRAGAITEAIESGASLEEVRKTATHSNSSQTSAYSRGEAQAVLKTMQSRAANRRVNPGR